MKQGRTSFYSTHGEKWTSELSFPPFSPMTTGGSSHVIHQVSVPTPMICLEHLCRVRNSRAVGNWCSTLRRLSSYVEMCILPDITVGERHYTNKTTATNKLETKTGPGWRNPQGFHDKANNGVLQKGDKH